MAEDVPFRIECVVEDSIVLIKLFGEIESENIPAIEEQFNLHLNEKRTNYIVDLKDLLFINSMGLGFLAAWSEKVKSEHGSMKIVNLSENLQDLFYLTQMDKILSICPDVESARKEFAAELS